MRLSWNEVRARAAEFARDWQDARYERGETQTFYNEFFEIFGVKRRRVASFEEPVRKLGDKRGFIDLFWKGVLLVEHKSAGRDLRPAKEQALDYFPGLKEYELPRYLLLSDFRTFELYDLEEDTGVAFRLHELPQNVERFAFVLGVEKRTFRDQDPVNVDASYLMGQLHDALEESGCTGNDLERFLVRLLFCLFADDTGIYEPRGIFQDVIENRTAEDGNDTGSWLERLFQTLNSPVERRATTLDTDLAQFPYVNGELFAERLIIPSFDTRMRQILIEACQFHWEAISPAIFGALFQSVMKKEERRKKGGHYTTEKNILKVIGPLFLDELRAEFDELKGRKRDRTRLLLEFQAKLAGMRFLDPACGCGNFLIITYRELRQLELELLRELFVGGQLTIEPERLSRIDVDQFYGIELEEFPARIAEVAMWMMDHIMNNRLSLEFGQVYARIPLKASPHILNADALETDWAELLDPADCTAVIGNPPFIGQSFQSPTQRDQMRRVLGAKSGRGGSLDYVSAWFVKAGRYVRANPRCRIGFVATNSITQGEQVAQLWPTLFQGLGLEIDFAHRTFAWGSDARGMAHVHVVILGLSHRDHERVVKRLFSYDDVKGDPVETHYRSLTAYLFDAERLSDRHLVVRDRNLPLCDVPRFRMGSKIVDNGHLIFDGSQRLAFLQLEPEADPYMRPLVGAEEYINGGDRWILSLADVSPSLLRKMPHVMDRIAKVRNYRMASRKAKTRELAESPTSYEVTTIPSRSFLVFPKVSSERRDYVPIGWLEPPIIPSQLLQVLVDADLWDFGVLTSRMHMTWLRYVGGRLESRYQYGIGNVYNTFPWPDASESAKDKIRGLAQAVLDARAAHRGATLADLYDPDAMPPDLRRAHRALDQAVDRLYRPSGFSVDRERVEHLFGLYEGLVARLPTGSARKPSRTRRGQPRRTSTATP